MLSRQWMVTNMIDCKGDLGLRSGCSCVLTALKVSRGLMKLLDWQLTRKLGFQIITLKDFEMCQIDFQVFSYFSFRSYFRDEVCFMSIAYAFFLLIF